jgi:hypothetical protein
VVVVVVSRVVVTAVGGGYVVVFVTLSAATPLLVPYVVLEEFVCVPSAPIDLCIVVVLKVPGIGATSTGAVVVVVSDDVDCAAATPVIMPSATAPATRSLVMSCP